MGHLANQMRSLASAGNPRAAELIENADELDKMINADLWDTKQVLGAWLRARRLVRDHRRAAALVIPRRLPIPQSEAAKAIQSFPVR